MSFYKLRGVFDRQGFFARSGQPAIMSVWHHETLAGTFAILEPMRAEHGRALSTAAADGNLWQLWYTTVPHPDNVATEIDRRLALAEQHSMMPFTVIDARSGVPIGMTSYMNVHQAHRRVEIGSTWYAATSQRTAINTQAKLLLLDYAFKQLDCVVVEFRTSFFNRRSRTAIERLGAKLDGVLRSHQISPEGIARDLCVYSIVASEWPAVERHLKHLLEDRQIPTNTTVV